MSALDLIQFQDINPPFCITDPKFCFPFPTTYSITMLANKRTGFETKDFVSGKLILSALKEKGSTMFLRDEDQAIVLNFNAKFIVPLDRNIYFGTEREAVVCNVKSKIKQDMKLVVTLKSPTSAEVFLVVKGINGSKEVAIYIGEPETGLAIATLKRTDNDKDRVLRVAANVDVALIVAICLAIENTIKL